MTKLLISKFSHLILQIYKYDSGCDFNTHSLTSLAEIFASNGAALVRSAHHGKQEHIIASLGFNQSQLQDMVGHVQVYGPTLNTMDPHTAGKVLIVSETNSHQTIGSTKKSQHPNSRLPSEKHWLLGFLPQDSKCQTLIWFCRDADQPNYSQEEKNLLELFLPHLQMAMKHFDTCIKLKILIETESQVLNRTPFGIILLDVNGRVHYHNNFAHDLIESNEYFIMDGDQIIIKNQEQNNKINDYFDKVRNSSDPLKMERYKYIMQNPSNNKRYFVKIVPIEIKHKSIVHLNDKFIYLQIFDLVSNLATQFDGLEMIYNLTNSEVKVCQRLFKNRNILRVAADLNISVNTVKTHLSRCFQKIGVSSQAELLQRLALHPRTHP